MTGKNRETVSAGTRKIQILMLVVAVACAVYGAAWTYLASVVDRETGAYITTNSDLKVFCPQRSVGGFPFRVGVSCETVALADKGGAFRISAGALRTTAVVYRLNRLIADLRGPASIEAPAGNMVATLSWERLRASLDSGEGFPRMAGVEADKPEAVLAAGGKLAADLLTVFARPSGTDGDMAISARGIAADPALTGGRTVPAFGIDLDVRLENLEQTWLDAWPATRSGIIRHAGFVVSEDSGIIASGPFSVGPDGLVDAELAVRIVDVGAVADFLRATLPEQAPMFEAMAAARPTGEGPADEWKLVVTIARSEIRLGFLPLGRLPPVAF